MNQFFNLTEALTRLPCRVQTLLGFNESHYMSSLTILECQKTLGLSHSFFSKRCRKVFSICWIIQDCYICKTVYIHYMSMSRPLSNVNWFIISDHHHRWFYVWPRESEIWATQARDVKRSQKVMYSVHASNSFMRLGGNYKISGSLCN